MSKKNKRNKGFHGKPENAELSANTLDELARVCATTGRHEISGYYLQKSLESRNSGGNNVKVYLPPDEPSFSFVGAATHIPQQQEQLQKSNTITGDSQLVKAIQANSFLPTPTPYRVNEALEMLGHYDGVKDLHSATDKTFQVIKKTAEHPIIDAIINYKFSEIEPFTQTPTNDTPYGFEIRLRDVNAPVTMAAARRIDDLTDLLLNGGFSKVPVGDGTGKWTRTTNPKTGEPGVWDGNHLEKAMGFRDFAQCFMRDSFSMDWACTRTEPGGNPDKYPIAFFTAADAQSIRLTSPGYEPKIAANKGKIIKYTELPPGGNIREPLREYSWDRMFSMVRRLRNDYFTKGYGHAEVEILFREIAQMGLMQDFQKTFFDENHIPSGILSLNGLPMDMDVQAESELRRQFLSMGGAQAMWRLLFMIFPPGTEGGVKFQALRDSMGAQGSLQFCLQAFANLINIACSVFQVNPEAIGFQGFSNKSATLNESDPQSVLDQSTDKSRNSTLVVFKNCINNWIIWRYDTDFELCWKGANSKNVQQTDQHVTAMLGFGLPLNQINDSLSIERIRIPLDPTLFNKITDDTPRSPDNTTEEWNKKIRDKYEKEFEELYGGKDDGISPWSRVPDAPTGSGMNGNQLYMQEIGALQTQKQKQEQQQQMMEQQGMQGQGSPFDGMQEGDDDDDDDEQGGDDNDSDDDDDDSQSNPFQRRQVQQQRGQQNNQQDGGEDAD